MKPSDKKHDDLSDKNRKMLSVLKQFRVVFKSIRRHYQSVEQRAGISGAQLWVLAHIAKTPGVTVGELARALAIHQSTASNLIRPLEIQALLSRKRQRDDRRTVRLYATAKGTTVLKRAPQPLIGVLQQALSDVPRTTLDALHLHLGKVITNMKFKDPAAQATLLSEI